jgi:hypothetical protein
MLAVVIVLAFIAAFVIVVMLQLWRVVVLVSVGMLESMLMPFGTRLSTF